MNRVISRVVAGSLVLFVSSATEPLLAQQGSPQSSPPAAQQSAPASQQQPPGQSTLPPVELPENPGQNSTNPQPLAQSPAKPPAPTPEPNGTAVAPPVQVSGGAASKPAGVAIAPPKQRRVRSLLIKLGFLAGAGAAIGTVVALSAASPGHVPGSPGH
ncbi:MAG TPA: hypothetical protein VF133_19500 [Terriglobales bacterium]